VAKGSYCNSRVQCLTDRTGHVMKNPSRRFVMTDEIKFSTAHTNGLHLNVAQAGPTDGPLVILLHGFPEFWYGWRKQFPALVAAGYRVWAPDQRGYATSDKPSRVRDYTLDK